MRKLTILFALFVISFTNASYSQIARGPYLQFGGTQHMTIRWRTNVATDSKVWYGTSPTNLTQTLVSSTVLTDHEIQLTGLTANTQCYYAVGDATGIFVGGDNDHFFSTHPQAGYNGKVRIWVLGDSGTKNKNARSVRDAYYNFIGTDYTDFILMLGDNAYPVGSDLEYQDAVFNNMYEDKIRQSVIWTTPGNHDTGDYNLDGSGAPYWDIFTFPTAGESGGVASGTESYYSMNYGDIHVVSLNSQNEGLEPGDPMLVWLENDLAASTEKWIIVIFHKPPYSKGSHDSDTGGTQTSMRENVVPILENYGVDLVMAGHSHTYERSYLINGHYGLSTTLDSATMILDGGDGREFGDGSYQKDVTGANAGKGAVYVVAGSSGKTSPAALGHPVHFYDAIELGSVYMEIESNRLDLKFIDATGNVDDYFTLIKEDIVGLLPTISITAPTNNQSYNVLQSISISANASDPDGTVTNVDFFVDGNLIGSDTSFPYELIWTPTGFGSYVISATVTDNDTNTTNAPPVTVLFGDQTTMGNIASSSDDAEEHGNNGSVKTGSSDIDMVNDGSNNDQIVGLRFTGMNLPQGANIISAYIQFTADETNSDAANLNIHAEASDNAITFSNNTHDITNRPLTTASVVWNPGSWSNIGDAGLNQQTSDLKDLVQEIVDRPGYTSSSAMAFIISGTGKRAAISYNADPAQDAVLHVDYSTLPPNNAPTVSINNPSDGATFTSLQPITIDAIANDSDGTINEVEFFIDGNSIGTDAISPYSIDWTPSTNGNYVLTAQAKDDLNALGQSAAVNITVNVPNDPPTVSITSPTDGTNYTSFQTISIDAAANDNDGTISQVEFFVDGNPIGTDTSTPYSFDWTPTVNGTYSLSATVIDNLGGTGAATAISVTVNVPNDLPTVSLTSPVDGAIFTSFQAISIDASANDTDGSIAQVEFFVDGNSIGTDTSNPFGTTWTATTNGTYILSAVATDNVGGIGTSANVNITFNVPNVSPSITLTDPADGTTYSSLQTITLSADANDSDGSIAQVEFFVDGSSVGNDVVSPYSLDWTPAGLGTYGIVATATDDEGATTSTPSISITFNNAPVIVSTSSQISNGDDDVEENGSNGSMYVNSSDLELVNDGSRGNQTVGLRFLGLNIPQGATITNAYIQFTADETNGTATNLTIRAEDSDNSNAFGTSSNFLSNLPTTTASVNWIPNSWNGIGNSGVDEQTPDLTSVLQEVVNRAGFSSSSALTLLITGTGKRTAESYNGVSSSAPILYVDYQTGGNSDPSISIINPSTGATFTNFSTIAIDATASDTDGTISQVEFFVDGVSIGTDNTSPYGTSWTPTTNGNYTLSATATDNEGGSASSSVNITVNVPNDLPTVSITAPVDGTTYTNFSTIAIDATASDTDGTISEVEFFVDGVSIGTDNSSPYGASWTPTGNGNYTLSAAATDNEGGSASSSVNITVNVPNDLPTVSITAPVDGTTYTNFSTIAIDATASDTDGTISQVEFFVDGVSIGTDNSSPYGASWTPTANGNYTLSTIATDNFGGTANASVGIVVNVPNTPPTVSLTSPIDGTVYSSIQTISIAATASDSDGTISQVEFFVDGNAVGIDGSSPYSVSWTPPVVGTYTLSAVATDNLTATTASNSVGITVNNTVVSVSTSSQISSGDDDAEQNGNTGSMSFSSSDLELVNDGSRGDQTIGMRFLGLNIPQGATITNAYIQFTSDENSSGSANLTISAEDSDNSNAFATSNNYLSNLPTTSTSVNWIPNTWSGTGSAGIDQQTPNLSAVIQELVDRAGFSESSAITLLITGTGTRTAESYNGVSSSAPILYVDYETGGGTGGGNNSPLVSITNPSDGSSFTSLATINIDANASDSDGSVTQVEFFVDGNSIGIDAASPYSASWTPTSFGSFTLTAIATDDSSATATSDPVSVSFSDPNSSTTVSFQIANDNDDGEEHENGNMDLTSSDLELVFDKAQKGNQTVGMRFTQVTIPQGAVIQNAFIQFQVDETKNANGSKIIYGEAADNSSIFSGSNSNFTSRNFTSANVSWNPVQWNTVGASGTDQQTPNLSPIIQEIVNRPGWSTNQALAIYIQGSGKRVAESHDGSPSGAPTLEVTYSGGGASRLMESGEAFSTSVNSFPNPFEDRINLEITFSDHKSRNIELIFMDVLGREISTHAIYIVSGKIVKHDLSYLPIGIYLLRISVEGQSEFIYQKLEKLRD